MRNEEFPHLDGDKSFALGVRFSLEQLVAWRLSGKSERGQGIHDKVDPQHLDGVERRFSQDGTTDKGHHEGHEVDSQLELQEFSDRVEDVSAPFHRSHNRDEVIIEKDDA